MKSIFIFLTAFISNLSFGQTQPLFKIIQNERIGYINNKGNIVIKPIFLNGNDFAEGLAAVRKNGLYGFIDSTGDFIIKPEYDYATNFINGITAVFKDGVPYFINKKNEIILPSAYRSLTFINQTKAIITTQTKKHGVIELTNNTLIVDTLYGSISDFKYGVAIVSEYQSQKQDRKKRRYAVIDTTGNIVVPFGRYENIKSFYEGYAVVEIKDKKNKDGNADGVIDAKGNLIFKRPYVNNIFIDGDFHNGLAKINLYKHWIPENKGTYSSSDKDYEGFINLKGEIVLDDTNYRQANDFSENRAFLKKVDGSYILIDKNFTRVGNDSFRNSNNIYFENHYAIVETDDGFKIIDTSGKSIIKFNSEYIDRIGLDKEYIVCSAFSDNDSSRRYSILDLKGNIISKDTIQEFDKAGFVNGVMKAIIDGRLTYLNKNGNIIWQQSKDTSNILKLLNIDFMNRGYFYAYSTPKNSEKDYSGGWATSSNIPQKNSTMNFPANRFAVIIDTTIIDTFAKAYKGYKLFISNNSTDTIRFNAQDSRLYMKLQAQDYKGEWKDIEYLPSSWCGNSYHKIALEPNAHWSFTIPDYHGEMQTKIRAELKYIDKNNPKKQLVVYSNTINCTINPAQFWNKLRYYPNGIMDSYFD